MNQESLLQHLARFNDAHDEYFRLFLEHFPLFHRNQSAFGPSGLIKKAIQLQVLAAVLGSKAMSRLNYIGFDKLVPFDNPVDWYNWKLYVEKNEISNNIYASIAIRIGSEISRMQEIAKLDAWIEYDSMATAEFLVSCQRYEIFRDPITSSGEVKEQEPGQGPEQKASPLTIQIHNVIPQHDSEAIDSVKKWDTNISFIANIIDIIKKFL